MLTLFSLRRALLPAALLAPTLAAVAQDAALAAAAADAAAAAPTAAASGSHLMLFWFLLATLALVLLIFGLLFVLIVVKMKPQLRALYNLPTVHDSWSGKALGLLVGDAALITGQYKDELMDHNYDGITEFDNDLPPWWKYGFYFTIVFAVGYMVFYHVTDTGDLQLAEYETEMQQAALLVSADDSDPNKLTTYTALTAGPDLDAGKALFATNCAACHGTEGEGKVGPNLTDDYWLHGGEINHVYKTIKFGVTSKGMVAWKGKLSGKQILQVASYIGSLHGTNPANPKELQGEKEAPAGQPIAAK
ncbi:cbb3-type cytochrome c oxidase N-terminal domain-containing protein [Hymenobacter psychrophilus]|uniref:Cytochrome c oxidase cbb3-type subunit 3 n=1 Tax=Hymenobacter psychrophilus TaxID=651662 RepID=A0A1H3K9F8_9BACT|nr:cbb3-type cytochrome c oxidase N-terminal domain-containing protein [Hymenobacter psychrophilus]SDY48174.1 cytochrome c oxidase cbb3-type subunit 3 [Hymenobacter psychrophilus]